MFLTTGIIFVNHLDFINLHKGSYGIRSGLTSLHINTPLQINRETKKHTFFKLRRLIN